MVSGDATQENGRQYLLGFSSFWMAGLAVSAISWTVCSARDKPDSRVGLYPLTWV